MWQLLDVRDLLFKFNLQVNLRYGDATQLTGGYTAAMLAISCLVAGVYLAVLLRCAMLLQRQRAVAAGAPGELRQAMVSTKRAVRPLGPWLWPAALTMMCGFLPLFTLLAGGSESTYIWCVLVFLEPPVS